MGRCPTYLEHESGRWVRGDDPDLAVKLRIEERALEAGGLIWNTGWSVVCRTVDTDE